MTSLIVQYAEPFRHRKEKGIAGGSDENRFAIERNKAERRSIASQNQGGKRECRNF